MPSSMRDFQGRISLAGFKRISQFHYEIAKNILIVAPTMSGSE